MHIGIFAKTFARPTVEAVLDAVAGATIRCVQFNMACTGLPSMPDTIAPEICNTIRTACEQRAIAMAAVSGTFNVIHPNKKQRDAGMQRLETLAASCKALGTNIITLSTGTRDPENMWRRHRDNDTPLAWSDLCASMEGAVAIAERHDIMLAFEPEVSNVVDTAFKGRRLLDEIRSARLRVVMDAANLFHTGELAHMKEVLNEAFDLLADDIVLAHAKDITHDGEAGHDAAGTGALDYDHYLALLRDSGYDGPLILHSLTEAQVPRCVAFLQAKLSRIG